MSSCLSRPVCVFALALVSVNCLSFKTGSPPEPAGADFEIVLCTEIDESGDLYKPVHRAVEFTAEKDRIICWLSIKNIYQETRLRWLWYSPAGLLFRESKEIAVNAEGAYLKAFTAIDALPPVPADQAGEWRVAIFADKTYLGGKTFSVVTRE